MDLSEEMTDNGSTFCTIIIIVRRIMHPESGLSIKIAGRPFMTFNANVTINMALYYK